MSSKFRLVALTAIAAVSIAAIAVAGMLIPARTASAQDATPVPMPTLASPVSTLPRTITVVGEGRVRVEPDIARINIGVEVLRPNVREASDANQEIVDAVIAAILGAGVAEEDVQTSGYSVFSERFGPTGPLPEDEVNYRVSNNVNVTVRDLESVGAVLDASIEAGANNIYGVEFAVDDTSAFASEARASAVEDARARAEDLASLTGVSLGSVVSVSEVVGSTPVFNAFRDSMAMGGGGTTIVPGQMNLTTQLQVVYELLPLQ